MSPSSDRLYNSNVCKDVTIKRYYDVVTSLNYHILTIDADIYWLILLMLSRLPWADTQLMLTRGKDG